MAENFTPINTQEELDAVIGPRLARERSAVTKQFEQQIAGFTSDLAARDSRIKELEEAAKGYQQDRQQLEELQRRVKTYETDSVKTRIAQEIGLPAGLSSRIQGETEEEIRKDAEALLGAVGRRQEPLFSNERGGAPGKSSDHSAALLKLAQDLGPNA